VIALPRVQHLSVISAARRAPVNDNRPKVPRHARATLLLLLTGIRPNSVRERLGQTQVSITIGVFSPAAARHQREALRRPAGVAYGMPV
jgi:hypothetical protein